MKRREKKIFEISEFFKRHFRIARSLIPEQEGNSTKVLSTSSLGAPDSTSPQRTPFQQVKPQPVTVSAPGLGFPILKGDDGFSPGLHQGLLVFRLSLTSYPFNSFPSFSFRFLSISTLALRTKDMRCRSIILLKPFKKNRCFCSHCLSTSCAASKQKKF